MGILPTHPEAAVYLGNKALFQRQWCLRNMHSRLEDYETIMKVLFPIESESFLLPCFVSRVRETFNENRSERDKTTNLNWWTPDFWTINRDRFGRKPFKTLEALRSQSTHSLLKTYFPGAKGEKTLTEIRSQRALFRSLKQRWDPCLNVLF